MLRTTRMLFAAAAIAVPTFAVAQDNRPVVVVFQFTNSSISTGAADFAGVQTGIQDLLVATSVPKGSFYHHFVSKEDFALQVVNRYLAEVHVLLEQSLGDPDRAPLERVRSFFERLMALYASQGYLGSLIGLLGQELAAVNTAFRRRMEGAFDAMGSGEVDRNWAVEHHDLWVRDLEKRGRPAGGDD